MGANKPATTTTTQSKTPWGATAGQMQGLTDQIGNLGAQTSLFAPSVSDATARGIGQLSALGQQDQSGGNKVLSNVLPGSVQGFNQGLGQLTSVAGGDYLNPNQYLAAALQPAVQDTTNKVNGQFTAMGRYGSGAHASELTKQIGNLESQAYLNNYNTERGRQDAAATTLNQGGYTGAGFAGALDQTAAQPAQWSLAAGQRQDAIDQATKQAPLTAAQWQQSQLMPMATAFGNTNTQSQTVQPVNPLTQGLGIGMMGLGMLGSPGMGVLAGGLGSMMNSGGWVNPDTNRAYNPMTGSY